MSLVFQLTAAFLTLSNTCLRGTVAFHGGHCKTDAECLEQCCVAALQHNTSYELPMYTEQEFC